MERLAEFEKLAEELAHLTPDDQLAFAEFLVRNNTETAHGLMQSILVAEMDDLFDNVPV